MAEPLQRERDLPQLSLHALRAGAEPVGPVDETPTSIGIGAGRRDVPIRAVVGVYRGGGLDPHSPTGPGHIAPSSAHIGWRLIGHTPRRLDGLTS